MGSPVQLGQLEALHAVKYLLSLGELGAVAPGHLILCQRNLDTRVPL